MTIRKLQTNFTSGEIGPDLFGRTDLPLYQNGAALVRNCRPQPQGGMVRRGGLAYSATIEDHNYQHKEWIFNAEQSYQLLFYVTHVAIHGGVVGEHLQTLTGCPWGDSEIGKLSVYCQGDYAFVCHPDLPIMQIRRIGAATFVLEPYRFERPESGAEQPIWQPYHRYIANNLAIRVEAIAGYSTSGWLPGATADITVTGYDFFQPEHVNTILLIENAQWEITSWINLRHVTAILRSPNFRVSLVENAFTINQGSSDVVVYDPFHDYAALDDVVIANATPFSTLLYQNVNGIREINAVTDNSWIYPSGAAVATATEVGGGLGAVYWSNDVNTVKWKEQMYSPVRGYPHCVSGYQSRLIFGGGRSAPNRLNFSRLEAPFNFDVGTGADPDSIQVGVSGRRTPTLYSVVGADHLQIFTSEGEYYIPRVEDQAGITPTTVAVLPQTFYGSLQGIQPVEFDGATLFISRNGRHLRQLVYGEKGYSAPDLSFVAHHLLSDPVWLAVQMEDPVQAAATAVVINSDGTLAALIMMRSEKVAAWVQHTTVGVFRNACAVDSRAFFIVRRTIAGVTYTFLERLAGDRILDSSNMGNYVGRSGQDYAWAGFGRFVGHPISIVVDGRSDIGLYTPNSLGQVLIPVRAETVEGGFGFAPHVRTLPPEMVLQDGPTPGEPRRVVSANVRYRNTLGMKVRGNKLLNTKAQLDLGVAAQLMTGTQHVPMFGWDTRGQVDITQSSNAPWTLVSANLELEF